MNECPCHNCICVPVCRHKSYHDLYFNCKLLEEYLKVALSTSSDDWDYENPTVFESLRRTLNPTTWGTTKSGNVEVWRKGKLK